jgi:hypothetical protein
MSNRKQERDRIVRRFRTGKHLGLMALAETFAYRLHHLVALSVKWSHDPDEDLDGLRMTATALRGAVRELEDLLSLLDWGQTLAVSSLQDEANVQLREEFEKEVAE